jgi:NADH-quinone oxidoreductase subunit E
MEDVLQRWIQTQNQWWDEYFTLLRQGGFAYPDWAGPQASPAEPVVAKKPAWAPKPQEKVAPEPPVAAPVTAEPVSPPKPQVKAAPKPVATAPQVEKPTKPAPAIPSAPVEPDDLKLISGIGPALERKLNACGISRYQELATLSDADIDRVEATIKSFGRIRRDNWIDQARTQHFEKYQEQI